MHRVLPGTAANLERETAIGEVVPQHLENGGAVSLASFGVRLRLGHHFAGTGRLWCRVGIQRPLRMTSTASTRAAPCEIQPAPLAGARPIIQIPASCAAMSPARSTPKSTSNLRSGRLGRELSHPLRSGPPTASPARLLDMVQPS